MARVEVQWDIMMGRDGLLLLLFLLLTLLPLAHGMLGLLVEWIGWGWLPWHVAGIQGDSLHEREKGVTRG